MQARVRARGAAYDVLIGRQSTMPAKRAEKGHSATRKKPARRRGKASRKIQQSSGATIPTSNTDVPARETLTRMRKLLLAALRLWELRRGIRD